ncbi:EpsG family protein [uncultured Planktosalinus sp.]|uniref:EpsG family protein n=1 Tax=uncultured Planktosalinus sp. TaxID=1810935 RepID=UPI0030DCB2A6
MFFSILSVILLQSLRKWTVGTDVVAYLYFFERLSRGESIIDFASEFSSLEMGFLYYNKLIAVFTKDPQIYLTIISATIFIPIGYVIYKNSKNIFVSLIALLSLIIFNFTFTGLRQSIAIAIVFLSFEYIKKQKWLYFLLLVLFASSFHTSALVFLAAYPLYFLVLRKKHYFIVLILFIGAFLVRETLLKSFVLVAFDKYGNSELMVATDSYTMLLFMFFIYTVAVFVKNKQSKSSLTFNAATNYILMAAFIQIAASESQVAMRAGYYYFIFVTLLLPDIISAVKIKKSRNSIAFIIVVACFTFYYITTINSSINLYMFYWE